MKIQPDAGRHWWAAINELANPETRATKLKQMYRDGLISNEQLWDILTSNHSPFDPTLAARTFRELGFKPFAGFPLQKLPQARLSGAYPMYEKLFYASLGLAPTCTGQFTLFETGTLVYVIQTVLSRRCLVVTATGKCWYGWVLKASLTPVEEEEVTAHG